jgi:hypothetical protein
MKLEFEKSLADDDAAQASVAWIEQSGFTTRFFYDRMMVYAPNGSVASECFSRADIIAFARRQSLTQKPAGGVIEVTPEKIHDLEEALRFLRERWRAAMAERDEWERRALAGERELSLLRGAANGSAAPPAKYTQLRRFIAREFHPDHVGASEAGKAERAELFKLLWAEISRLDKA